MEVQADRIPNVKSSACLANFFNGGAVLSKTTRVLFAAVACAFVVTQATAQDEFKPSVSIGGGLRAGVSWGDDDDSYGFNNTRLYINASAYSWLDIEVNTNTGGDADVTPVSYTHLTLPTKRIV